VERDGLPGIGPSKLVHSVWYPTDIEIFGRVVAVAMRLLPDFES
jgi:hypothetical protein